MSGQANSNLLSFLKILTPDEIERFLNRKKRGRVQMKIAVGSGTLSAGFIEEDDESDIDASPKIVPLEGGNEKAAKDGKEAKKPNLKVIKIDEENNQKIEEADDDISVEATGELSSLGIMNQYDMRRLQNKKMQAEKGKEISASMFILRERTKLKDSKEKLSGQMGIGNYQKTASQDFKVAPLQELEEGEEHDEDDDGSVSSTGILVNTKQH